MNAILRRFRFIPILIAVLLSGPMLGRASAQAAPEFFVEGVVGDDILNQHYR